MYDQDALDAPVSREDFWKKVRLNFDHAAFVLNAPLESKAEALQGDARGSLAVVPYREISSENDQREFYRALGLDLIVRLEPMIGAKLMSVEFTHCWGVLMFCHGMLAGYLFDDSQNLGYGNYPPLRQAAF